MDITDVTGAGRVKQTNPFNYGVGGTSATVTPAGTAPAGPALDAVINNYVSKVDPKAFVNRMTAGRQADQASALGALQNLMYETSGGPNQAAIRQLEAQRLAAQKNYKTNRADAQNLYGVLSQDIQEMGAELQSSYGTAISDSQAQATARQAALAAEQARQQANRQKVAAELGLAPESIQTNYASDEALNTGMGNVAAGATSFENLLRSQQGSAQERTNRMVTATGNTRNQTLMNMKALLDAQVGQVNAQIMAEKGKTPTQKLTPLGKILSGAMNEQTLKRAQAQFPELFGSETAKLTQGEQAAQDVMTQLGITASEYSALKSSAIKKVQEGDNAGLTEQEIFVLQSTGLPQWMLGG